MAKFFKDLFDDKRDCSVRDGRQAVCKEKYLCLGRTFYRTRLMVSVRFTMRSGTRITRKVTGQKKTVKKSSGLRNTVYGRRNVRE